MRNLLLPSMVCHRLHSKFSAIGRRRATHWTALSNALSVRIEVCSNPSTTMQSEWREKCWMPIQFIVFMNLQSPVWAWGNGTTGVCSNHENFKIYINNLLLRRKWCYAVNGTEWSARYLLPLHKCVVWQKKSKIKRRRKHINTQTHTQPTPCTYAGNFWPHQIVCSCVCDCSAWFSFRPSHTIGKMLHCFRSVIFYQNRFGRTDEQKSAREPHNEGRLKMDTQRFGAEMIFGIGSKLQTGQNT